MSRASAPPRRASRASQDALDDWEEAVTSSIVLPPPELGGVDDERHRRGSDFALRAATRPRRRLSSEDAPVDAWLALAEETMTAFPSLDPDPDRLARLARAAAAPPTPRAGSRSRSPPTTPSRFSTRAADAPPTRAKAAKTPAATAASPPDPAPPPRATRESSTQTHASSANCRKAFRPASLAALALAPLLLLLLAAASARPTGTPAGTPTLDRREGRDACSGAAPPQKHPTVSALESENARLRDSLDAARRETSNAAAEAEVRRASGARWYDAYAAAAEEARRCAQRRTVGAALGGLVWGAGGRGDPAGWARGWTDDAGYSKGW